MIRRAETKDIADITNLHYMAGPNMFQYYMASDEEKACALLQHLAEKPDTPFSKDFFWMCDEEDTIEGAISLYPGEFMKVLERNIGKYGKEMMKIAGLWTIFKMAPRGLLNRYMPEISADELYIEALAVYPEFRGRGIGSSLLAFASDHARELHFARLSLLVETTNRAAIELYKKNGFRIVETQGFNRKVQKHNLFGVHKMITEAAI